MWKKHKINNKKHSILYILTTKLYKTIAKTHHHRHNPTHQWKTPKPKPQKKYKNQKPTQPHRGTPPTSSKIFRYLNFKLLKVTLNYPLMYSNSLFIEYILKNNIVYCYYILYYIVTLWYITIQHKILIVNYSIPKNF